MRNEQGNGCALGIEVKHIRLNNNYLIQWQHLSAYVVRAFFF